METLRPALRQFPTGKLAKTQQLNEIGDALNAAFAGQFGNAPIPFTRRSSGLIAVRNTTGAGLSDFAIVGLGALSLDPASDPQTFQDDPCVLGETPTTASHTGKFAILQEPLDDGETGVAIVSGVSVCKVNVTDAAHTHADAADGQSGYLASGTSGLAQILGKPAGTGQLWCLVRLGGGAGGLVPVTLASDGGSNSDGTSAVSLTYTVTHAITSAVLGTSVVPEHNRVTVPVLPATRGTAWMEGATVHLILTDEAPDFRDCAS
jgi:hypothetical protein